MHCIFFRIDPTCTCTYLYHVTCSQSSRFDRPGQVRSAAKIVAASAMEAAIAAVDPDDFGNLPQFCHFNRTSEDCLFHLYPFVSWYSHGSGLSMRV